MDKEMRTIRRIMLAHIRKDYPKLTRRNLARRFVVMKGRDGSYTGWIDEGRESTILDS